MRGLAAIVVVAGHSAFMYPLQPRPQNNPLAVEFFFCLSGFVLAFSYSQKLAAPLRFRDFLGLRWIRLYPMYLLGTLLAFARVRASSAKLAFLHAHPKNFVVAALLAVLFLPSPLPVQADEPMYLFNPPARWIFFELIVNVVFAAVVRLQKARFAIPVLWAACLVYLMFRAFRGMPSLFLVDSVADFLGNLARAGLSFFAGVLVFAIHTRTAQRLCAPAFAFVPPALLLALLMLHPGGIADIWYQLLCAAFVFPALVCFGSIIEVPTAAASTCVALGELAYPIYILHAALYLPRSVQSRLQAMPAGRASALSWLSIFMLAGFAFLVGRSVDAPLRVKITEWVRSRQSKSAAEALAA